MNKILLIAMMAAATLVQAAPQDARQHSAPQAQHAHQSDPAVKSKHEKKHPASRVTARERRQVKKAMPAKCTPAQKKHHHC